MIRAFRPRALAAAAASLLLLSGCDQFEPREFSEVSEVFRLAQSKWNAANVQSYDFTIKLLCIDCPVSDLNVQVRNDVVVSVKDRAGEDVPAAQVGAYDTIDELFGHIGEAIDSGADGVSVSYDGALGYPHLARLDASYSQTGEELGFNVTNFVQK